MRGSKPAGSASDFCEGIGKKLQAEFCDHYLRGCGALVTIHPARKQGGGGQGAGGIVSHTKKRGWWTARGPAVASAQRRWLGALSEPRRHRCIKGEKAAGQVP